MIFTFVHLDLLLPPLPHACQASQERKTDKNTGKNKGKTKFNIKILLAFSFLEPFWGAYVRKAKGASFSKFFGFFFYFVLAISSISVANDFVFDQEFDRMIAPI